MELVKGTSLSLYTSGSYQVIPGVVTLSPGAVSVDTQEVTPIHTTTKGREYVPTLTNVGDWSFTIAPYDGSDPMHVAVIEAHGTEAQFKYTPSGNELGSQTFSGIVTNCKPVTEKDKVVAYDVTVKVTGTLTDELATISSVSFTDAHAPSYETGDVMELTVIFDELVKVTGTPRITVNLDGSPIYATYSSGSNTNVLKFTHTVQVSESAEAGDVVVVSPIGLNAGTINDSQGQAATLTFTLPNTTTFEVNPA